MIFKKIVIAGGTGQIGKLLCNHFKNISSEIIVLSRNPKSSDKNIKYVSWDGRTIDSWIQELEGVDVLINLTGKNVNCRLTEKNKSELISSRINSVLVLSKAIDLVNSKPKLWIQSSAIGIYKESYNESLNEQSNLYGSDFMAELCKEWEKTFIQQTEKFPLLRKVIIRTGLVLSHHEGVLPRLIKLVKLGLGGHQGSGKQYVSWINEKDFAEIIEYIASNNQINDVINLTSPYPLTNAEMMKAIRKNYSIKIGLSAPSFVIKIVAFLIGTQSGLVLNSHKIIPKRIVEFGYKFKVTLFNQNFE